MRRLTNTYAGRLVAWRLPTVHDNRRFPTTDIASSTSPVHLPLRGAAIPDVADQPPGSRQIIDWGRLDAVLERNATTAFLMLRGGEIVRERYFGQTRPESPVAAFSISKSLLSALVGIALDRHILGSLSEPVLSYLPELTGPGFQAVTLEHLLTMSAGLRYRRGALPWGEDARYYYAPDRWQMVLRHARVVDPPGTVWNYNDFSPTILAEVLRRATGDSLTSLTHALLFEPAGIPHSGQWILDSAATRLENAAAGLYATPRTLAAFGQLHLDGGRANCKQVIPEAWVHASTSICDSDSTALHDVDFDAFTADGMAYKYYWWVWRHRPGPADYLAIGNYGQFIYVAPTTRTVIVRTGAGWSTLGASRWLHLLRDLAHRDSG